MPLRNGLGGNPEHFGQCLAATRPFDGGLNGFGLHGVYESHAFRYDASVSFGDATPPPLIFESMSFGERLREIIEARGTDQSKLAKNLHISSQAVNQWVNARTAPRGGRWHEVCKLLNVTVDTLLAPPGSPIEEPGRDGRSHLIAAFDMLDPDDQAIVLGIADRLAIKAAAIRGQPPPPFATGGSVKPTITTEPSPSQPVPLNATDDPHGGKVVPMKRRKAG